VKKEGIHQEKVYWVDVDVNIWVVVVVSFFLLRHNLIACWEIKEFSYTADNMKINNEIIICIWLVHYLKYKINRPHFLYHFNVDNQKWNLHKNVGHHKS
jgi:hypothetical protein